MAATRGEGDMSESRRRFIKGSSLAAIGAGLADLFARIGDEPAGAARGL